MPDGTRSQSAAAALERLKKPAAAQRTAAKTKE
jgi:hypothetical protein